MLENELAIIVQARIGSTRLPGKMQRELIGGKSLLEVVIHQLNKTGLPIIIATSQNSENDWIEQVAIRMKCKVYRGEESNVLKRFIGAAKEFNVQKIIRVCADNPFILPQYIMSLSDVLINDHNDYVAFAFKEGLPTIKSHQGLFAEGCTLDGLEKIAEFTQEPLYCEHVTNYFYANPDRFNIRFLTLPKILESREDLRLTIDTLEDFNLSSKLYKSLVEQNKQDDVNALLNEVDKYPYYSKTMKNEIERNSK